MKFIPSVAGHVLSRFVNTNFLSLQCLKVEVWSSGENQRDTDFEETHSICGISPFSLGVSGSVFHEQAEPLNAAC